MFLLLLSLLLFAVAVAVVAIAAVAAVFPHSKKTSTMIKSNEIKMAPGVSELSAEATKEATSI